MAMSGKLKVCEIFSSIQGEGYTLSPSVFIRFSGCNLYCKWCDTKYSWSNGTEMSVEEIIEKAGRVRKGCNNVVLTGGEPLLQDREELGRLIQELVACGFDRIEVETNGTQHPLCLTYPGFLCSHVRVSYNISPKLSNSGVEERKRIRYDILKEFLRLPGNFFILKFVVNDEKDVEEVEEIVKKLSSYAPLSKSRIFLMPEGKNREEILMKARWLWGKCIEKGWNYSPREHILVWDNKKGI
jgi:organic radical activating enzyme